MVSEVDLRNAAHFAGYPKVDKWVAVPYDYQFYKEGILFSVKMEPSKLHVHGYSAHYTILNTVSSRFDSIRIAMEDGNERGVLDSTFTHM